MDKTDEKPESGLHAFEHHDTITNYAEQNPSIPPVEIEAHTERLTKLESLAKAADKIVPYISWHIGSHAEVVFTEFLRRLKDISELDIVKRMRNEQSTK